MSCLLRDLRWPKTGFKENRVIVQFPDVFKRSLKTGWWPRTGGFTLQKIWVNMPKLRNFTEAAIEHCIYQEMKLGNNSYFIITNTCVKFQKNRKIRPEGDFTFGVQLPFNIFTFHCYWIKKALSLPFFSKEEPQSKYCIEKEIRK